MRDDARGSEGKKRPRVTIRLIMVVVLAAAVDFVLAKGLRMNYGNGTEWPDILLLVGLYDVLAFFVALVPGKLASTARDDPRMYWMRVGMTTAVLLVFAGFPLAVAVAALLSGSW